MGKFVDYDHHTGIIETTKTDGSGVIEVTRTQDTQEILDYNHQQRSNSESGFRHGNFHKVASIPLILIEQWNKELKQQGRIGDIFHKENRSVLIAKINSNQYHKLRTKECNV